MPQQHQDKPVSPAEIAPTPPETEYPVTEEVLSEIAIPDDHFICPVYQYTNTKYAFSISYPQTWTFQENVYDESIGGYGVKFTSERSLVDIVIVAGNINGTLEEITRNYAINTENNVPTTWSVGRYSTSIKDPETYLIQIDGQVPLQGTMVDVHDASIWFFHNDTLYFVHYTAFGPLSKSREYLSSFYSMLNSFKFIE